MARNAAVLFGRIAVERGHLTAEQLETLLQEQSQAAQGAQSVLLGDLCVQKGLLTQNQVRRILESQREAGNETTTLGALAVRNGFATPEEVELALEAQKHPDGSEGKSPAKLGEILLAMGTLTSQKHKALLLAQARLRDDDLDASTELELETREIPIAEGPPAPSAEAVAWLIQETGEGTGQLFRLGASATIGRMPAHDVAVADMGASREHASIEYSAASRQHVLRDLDSRNGTFINGIRVEHLTPLQTGDLIRIGESSFRYAAAAPPSEAGPLPAAPPRPARLAGILRGLSSGLHAQRKGFLLASLAGLVAPLLPWTRVAGQPSVLGLRTVPGLVALVLFAAAAALSLLRDRSKPLPRPFLLGLLGATSIAAILAIVRLVVLALDPDAGAGPGIPLAILAGLSVPVALWFTRTPLFPPVTWGGKPASPPAPPGAPDAGVWARIRGTAIRAGETTVRVIQGLSGKKARERARADDRRDELLVVVGRAALDAAVAGPEAESAKKALEALEAAKERFEKVGKETSARDLLIAKSDLKWAEARLERALRKLGRLALDRDLSLESRQSEVAEIRALDLQLKDEA